MDIASSSIQLAPGCLESTQTTSTPDLSHHLSALGRARKDSPLKGMYKYAGLPGMISLAGGMPHPSVFPFESLAATTLPSDAYSTAPPSLVSRSAATTLSWLASFFKSQEALKIKTQSMSIPKYGEGKGPEEVKLETALQYGGALGLPALQHFLRDFVALAYAPAHPEMAPLINAGSTDAWQKIVTMLCEPGEAVLVEEWSYPGGMNGFLPTGGVPVPIAMDGIGMKPEALEKVLAEWDEQARGRKRPHVMYTVPIGQNPTGATMTGQRKAAIYAVCVKYDVIICEDDPYFFLQLGLYTPPTLEAGAPSIKKDKDDCNSARDFIASLEPSFLKFDYQGRVIRIDTFSKNICPGSRMGYFTCHPTFFLPLQRASESSTQGASGFSQALVTKLLVSQWKVDGYVRWLRGIQATYTMRRDWMCDAFAANFELTPTSDVALFSGGAAPGYVAYSRSKTSSVAGKEGFSEKGSKKALLSFVPPTSGMFVWLRINLSNHPSYTLFDEPEETLIDQLWTELAEHNVLVSPGEYFSPYGKSPDGESAPDERTTQAGYFRLAFSYASHEEINKAIKTFSEVLEAFFKP